MPRIIKVSHKRNSPYRNINLSGLITPIGSIINQSSGPNSLYPNQPGGFTRICEHDFTVKPGGLNSVVQNGIAGYWWRDSTRESNLSISADGIAGQSIPNYLRQKFPVGLEDGDYPTFFIGWNDSALGANINSDNLSEIYVSIWLRIYGNGITYENQSTGTKLFYVPYMNLVQNNQSTLFLKGNTPAGTLSYSTSWELRWYFREVLADGSDPGGGAVGHGQNIDATKYITVATWHHVEGYLKRNTLSTPPTADGIFKLWIDGHLVSHYTDMRYSSEANPRGFYQFRGAPVFGGDAGEIKTRDDYIDFDHVYVSGVAT